MTLFWPPLVLIFIGIALKARAQHQVRQVATPVPPNPHA